jgi:hypothetical protein
MVSWKDYTTHNSSSWPRLYSACVDALMSPRQPSPSNVLLMVSKEIFCFLGGGVALQVDNFTAERYCPHQITRQNSKCGSWAAVGHPSMTPPLFCGCPPPFTSLTSPPPPPHTHHPPHRALPPTCVPDLYPTHTRVWRSHLLAPFVCGAPPPRHILTHPPTTTPSLTPSRVSSMSRKPRV